MVLLLSLQTYVCEVWSMHEEAAQVEAMRNSDEFFSVRNASDDEVGKFKVEIYENARKNPDGSISFVIKLRDIEFPSSDWVIYYGDQKIEPRDGSSGKDVFTVSIPHDELKNEKFIHSLKLSSNDAAAILEEIKFMITPNAFLESDVKEVQFGSLTYSNQHIYGNKQSVSFKYSVLKGVQCKILSANQFRLRHENNYISYSVDAGPHECEKLSEEMKVFQLDSQNSAFTIAFDPSGYCEKMPVAGDYEDYLTIELSCD
jgi:hypothetical protein